MLVQLSTVEDSFLIKRRGVVVVPGLPADFRWRIDLGTMLTLERPDGSRIEAAVRGLESLPPGTALLLDLPGGKAEAPPGTTLWVDDSAIRR